MQRDYVNAKPILDAMLERNSVRTFQDKPIPDEVLSHILDVSIQAASGGCLQAYSIIVVKDAERKKKLCEACGGQKFVETAAVDLIYCLDWHKYQIYNKMKKAPLVAHRAFSHFIITAQDIMCAAQSAETSAHLCGIGSCYVGSILGQSDEVKDMLNLPEHVYPMTVLSMGYQKNDGMPRRRHMAKDMMVFDEVYPELDENRLYEAFEEKLQGMRTPLPKTDPARHRMLDLMKRSLLTTYSEEETDAIMADIIEKGEFNETQRRFGLHYAAAYMVGSGRRTIEDMRKCGIVIDD